jgi:ABC-2 type transport system permease protein
MNIIRVAKAELRRFRSLSLILASFVLPAFFAAVTTAFSFSNAASGNGSPGGPGGRAVTVAMLSERTGYLEGIGQSFSFLGLIAVVIACMTVATDYSQGTLRNLLVRQPSRWRLLSGKLLALLAVLTASAFIASASGTFTANLVASGNGVSKSAWGLSAFIPRAAALAVGLFGWAAIGTLLATVLRSVPAAIGIGVGWALPVETILGSVWKSGKAWFPGGVFEAFSAHGNATVGFGRAALVGAVYLAIAVVAAVTVFARRDVTA